MAIKRYYATADNTITNAYKANLSTRGVSGNMGQSDILEVFNIYGQVSSSAGLSNEASRILIQFDTTQISDDRTAGNIPASGSVSFFLRLYSAPHSQTTPKNFTLVTSLVSQSWDEGLGLDMENYTDIDASNWLTASNDPVIVKWTTEGGDYITGSDSKRAEYSFNQTFDTGFEDLEVDISHGVESILDGTNENYGFGIKLTGSQETGSNSYYTKMFFARGSQFFLKRPVLEARWDSSKKDDRGDFFLSSSLVPASDNLMKLYLYNIVRGELTNIPVIGTGDLHVSIYSGTLLNTGPSGSKIGFGPGGGTVTAGHVNTTASHVEAGIYSCSFAYTASAITTIFDVWHKNELQYHTGSAIKVQTFDSTNYNFDNVYVSTMTNLRAVYSPQETARFRLYVRSKDWSPTIYSVASKDIENTIINDAYYKVTRISDNFDVIAYGTGSSNQTRLSYDASGSYFDLPMNVFKTDDVYEISFVYVINGSFVEQPERFRFRVE
tara:strand:- start:6085 stop:7569 length:1485 start_codon:yes stop_codon:yes gene_type:complete